MKVDVAYSKDVGSDTSISAIDVFSEDAPKGINEEEVDAVF